MTNDDVKLVIIFALTCAAWYAVGFTTGYTVSCEIAFQDGKLAGHSEGIAEASTPSEQ